MVKIIIIAKLLNENFSKCIFDIFQNADTYAFQIFPVYVFTVINYNSTNSLGGFLLKIIIVLSLIM